MNLNEPNKKQKYRQKKVMIAKTSIQLPGLRPTCGQSKVLVDASVAFLPGDICLALACSIFIAFQSHRCIGVAAASC